MSVLFFVALLLQSHYPTTSKEAIDLVPLHLTCNIRLSSLLLSLLENSAQLDSHFVVGR
jgi:hypothetical protein